MDARKSIKLLFVASLVGSLFFVSVWEVLRLKKLASVLLAMVLVCCAVACVMPVLAHPQDHYVSYNGSKTEDGYDVVVIQRFCVDCGEPLPLNVSQYQLYCDACGHEKVGYLWVLVLIFVGLIFAMLVVGLFLFGRN